MKSSMAHDFQQDIDVVGNIHAVTAILDVVCGTTGMGFAAVARVTENRWVACSVRDDIAFGLEPGGELKVETTICHEIRQSGAGVVIDEVAADSVYRGHATPALYGFQSYISLPIILPGGEFFGTLCAIDPRPMRVNTPETVGMFKLFAELIAFHIDAARRLAASEASLLTERAASELREQFIAVLGHDLRNPLAAIDGGTQLLSRMPLSEKASSIVGLMQKSTSRMSALIEDVLDFARGRLGGGIVLAKGADEPLEEVLKQVVAELRASWPDRVIEEDYALDRPVDCDRGRMAQMVSNLLANALTYGAADAPVRIRAMTDTDNLEIAVGNAGAPIPPAALERLFQPFARGDVVPSQQGLGLGLYIAAEVARAHGGTLHIPDAALTGLTVMCPVRHDQ
jgi:signal transduction histidine kinase